MRRYSRTVNNVSASDRIPIEKASGGAASSAAALSEFDTRPISFAKTGSRTHKPHSQGMSHSAHVDQFPPIEVYTAYTDDDELYFNAIKKLLNILRRQRWPISCHESEISHSNEWLRSGHLVTANLILLLVGDTFLDTDFCYSNQMYTAVNRHTAEDLCYVIPIMLYPLPYLILKGTPFGELDFLPTNGMPISEWNNPHKAYANIMDYLIKKLKKLKFYPL